MTIKINQGRYNLIHVSFFMVHQNTHLNFLAAQKCLVADDLLCRVGKALSLLLLILLLIIGQKNGCCLGRNCWSQRTTMAVGTHSIHIAGDMQYKWLFFEFCTQTPYQYMLLLYHQNHCESNKQKVSCVKIVAQTIILLW